jgi:hypothetical protein
VANTGDRRQRTQERLAAGRRQLAEGRVGGAISQLGDWAIWKSGDGVAFVNLQSFRAGPELRRPSGAPSAVHQRTQQVPANLEAHRVDRKVSDRLGAVTK